MKNKVFSLKGFIFIILLLFIGVTVAAIMEVRSLKQFLNEKASITFYDYRNHEIMEIKRQTVKRNDLNHLMIGTFSKTAMINTILGIRYGNHLGIRRGISSFYLDHIISKEDLTIKYINEIHFQNGIIGLGTAADYYFHKPLLHLKPIESIYLMTLNNLPLNTKMTNISFYLSKKIDTFKNISANEKKSLKKEVPNILSQLHNSKTAYLESYLEASSLETAKDLKLREQQIMHKQLKVYTTLDTKTQHAVFTRFNQHDDLPQDDDVDSSMIILNNQTGAIVGLIGARNPYASTVNKAVTLKREPGSTFKPLIVYGPAIEQGWKPNDMLLDKPFRIGSFKPVNYDYKYRGEVSLKDALTMSYNVPSVWLLEQIGLNTGVRYLNKFGFHYNPKDNYGIALGYISDGVTLLQLAQSYTVFSNNGVMIPAYTVRKITDSNKNVLFQSKSLKKKIFQKSTVDQMQSLLTNVIQNGTGKKAQINQRAVFGKTGTTSYDGWFVGTTNQYTAAVWIGTYKLEPALSKEVAGGEFPAKMYQAVISEMVR